MSEKTVTVILKTACGCTKTLLGQTLLLPDRIQQDLRPQFRRIDIVVGGAPLFSKESLPRRQFKFVEMAGPPDDLTAIYEEVV